MNEQGQISWTKLAQHGDVKDQVQYIDFIKVLNIGLPAHHVMPDF